MISVLLLYCNMDDYLIFSVLTFKTLNDSPWSAHSAMSVLGGQIIISVALTTAFSSPICIVPLPETT